MGTLAQPSLLCSSLVHATSEADNIAWMSDKHLKLCIQSRTSNCPPQNTPHSLAHISITSNSVFPKAQAQTRGELFLTALSLKPHTHLSARPVSSTFGKQV